jgi:hypothetical protein
VKPPALARRHSAGSLPGPTGAAILTAAAVLAGCGAQGAGRDEPVRASVEAYFRAVDRANGAAICARLGTRLRRHVARLQSATCEKALADEARRLPENLSGYRIVAVRAAGATATVTLDGGGFQEEMRLEREAGTWRITSAPGLGQ